MPSEGQGRSEQIMLDKVFCPELGVQLLNPDSVRRGIGVTPWPGMLALCIPNGIIFHTVTSHALRPSKPDLGGGPVAQLSLAHGYLMPLRWDSKRNTRYPSARLSRAESCPFRWAAALQGLSLSHHLQPETLLLGIALSHVSYVTGGSKDDIWAMQSS